MKQPSGTLKSEEIECAINQLIDNADYYIRDSYPRVKDDLNDLKADFYIKGVKDAHEAIRKVL